MTGREMSIEQARQEIFLRYPDVAESLKSAHAFQHPYIGVVERQKLHGLQTYVCFPIETLLQEASLLIDRCVSVFEAKLDIEARLLEFWIDHELFLKQEAVRRAQISGGEFSLPKDVARAELDASQSALQKDHDTEKQLSDGVEAREPTSTLYAQRVDVDGQITVILAPKAPGVKQEILDHSKIKTENQLAYEYSSALAARSAQRSSIAQRQGQLEAAKFKLAFEALSEPLKLEAFENDVDAKRKRAALAMQPGVGLNYAERLAYLQSIFERDYLSAFGRLLAIKKGIQDLFGIVLPDLVDGAGVHLSFREVVLWTRDALDAMRVATELDISFHKDISVRNAVGEAKWQDLIRGTAVKFSLDSASFGSSTLVRLVDLQCVVNCADKVQVWSMALTVPVSGFLMHGHGAKRVVLDQSMIPKIIFGDVRDSSAIRQGGKVEARVLQNISPLGEWVVQVDSTSIAGHSASGIDDVIVTMKVKILSA